MKQTINIYIIEYRNRTLNLSLLPKFRKQSTYNSFQKKHYLLVAAHARRRVVLDYLSGSISRTRVERTVSFFEPLRPANKKATAWRERRSNHQPQSKYRKQKEGKHDGPSNLSRWPWIGPVVRFTGARGFCAAGSQFPEKNDMSEKDRGRCASNLDERNRRYRAYNLFGIPIVRSPVFQSRLD